MTVRRAAFLSGTILLAMLLANAASADENAVGSEFDDEQRFVSVGQLARLRMGQSQQERFVLLNQQGDVVNTLRPADGVDLEAFVGQEVGVTARTLVDGDIPVLSAESVTSFGEARQLVRGSEVRLAGHDEEYIASNSVLHGAPVVTTGPVTYDSGAPIVSPQYPILDHGELGVATCDGNCGSKSCSTCAACPCGPLGQMWVRAEYLLWWTDGMRTPPLVSTSPAGTLRSNAGVLGTSGAEVYFGDDDLFDASRNGGRFRLGKWCDSCQWIGFETDFFFLGDESDGIQCNPIGDQILARPFFNTQTGQNDSELVQFPGLLVGTVHVDAETSLWSIGPRLRINLACERLADDCVPCSDGGYRFDLLVGYRYANLDDRLAIRESLSTVDPNNQTFFDLEDSFDTDNDFHGADLGVLWEGYRGPWSLELLGRVGIGNTRQSVTIAGQTTTVGGGATFEDPGGILALSSNIGSYNRNEFTVLPEVSATLGYALSPRTRFLVGYTFFYWSEVVRAGDQIDLNVNTDLLPPPLPTTGPQSPAFAFVDTDFWAQGISFGLDYRW